MSRVSLNAFKHAIAEFAKIPDHVGTPTSILAVGPAHPCVSLMKCGAYITDDIQSGPIYCNDPAEFMADVLNNPGTVIAVCSQHRGRLDKYPKELPVPRVPQEPCEHD